MQKAKFLGEYFENQSPLYKMTENLAIRTCRRIVREYAENLADAKRFPGLSELAYSSAMNVIDVNRCLEAVDRNYVQQDRDTIYAHALVSHHRRALAYWKLMNFFKERVSPQVELEHQKESENYKSLSYDQSGEDNSEAIKKSVSRLESLRKEKLRVASSIKRSSEKILKLEKIFPNYEVLVTDPIQIGRFKELVDLYPEGKIEDKNDITPFRIAELAFWSSKNTIDMSRCIEVALGSTGEIGDKRDELYQRVYDSHQNRAFAFWETMHQFHVENYTRAHKLGLKAEEKRLWGLVESSHVKVAKLEKRLFDYHHDATPDREIITNGLPKLVEPNKSKVLKT